MKRHLYTTILALGVTLVASSQPLSNRASESDLAFPQLAHRWDEAMPLGNATLGALVWQKGEHLRLSLDRIDLWDLRPIKERNDERFDFGWVKQAVREGDYDKVLKFDREYHGAKSPAPSKLLGAALEFKTASFGEVESVRLYLKDALCQVKWKGGATLQTFVHAEKPVGWFLFEGVKGDFIPTIVPPAYAIEEGANDNSHAGASLPKLGYKQGAVVRDGNRLTYHQQGWGDFSYTVVVEWIAKGDKVYGVWSITSSLVEEQAQEETSAALRRGVKRDYRDHLAWWNAFWAKSTISVPDKVLQKQYDNEIYKLGSVARETGYPISLQAIWTADNGKLPPWRGDFHHDLNTQLSYWPVYTGNYLSEGLYYINTMWSQRDKFRKYTKDYFKAEGVNIPGVTALDGEGIGGWIQYAFSPTIGAWIIHHFYLHWVYSQDEQFLKEVGYPMMKDVATFFEQTTIRNKEGYRTLEISSSPEIFNNTAKAWFLSITNFDLALIRSTFHSAAEMADALGKDEEAAHWRKLEGELPPYSLDEEGGLAIAKGCNYDKSHRHFSHALAIHPLGLLSWNNKEDKKIIDNTIAVLEKYGTSRWTGYSFTWWANIQARNHNGEVAAAALRDFAECFCLKNTFHANGDQSGTGKSRFRYRPFTLEGNFAGAAALQEMLLQSHNGYIEVLPAIPASWRDVSFENLRARGAVLVSATKRNGAIERVVLKSEKGGIVTIKDVGLKTNKRINIDENGVITLSMKAGEVVVFK